MRRLQTTPTTGSVSLETVKQYIESQRSEEHQAKKNQQFQKKTLACASLWITES